MNTGFLTVSQLNGYIKNLFELDDVLCGISVCGEISNMKLHSSGHLYFTLKDENSTVSAVMFRYDLSRISFRPENGMRVIVSGKVGVYERSGQYQIYVSYMKPDGIGQLYMQLELLKKKLAAEGLFDPARKKKLPEYPRRIGVVTSPTGAVIRDIIKVTGRRYPLADIVLFGVHVQGNEAIEEICGGIEYFNIEKNVDLIIVGRGGGSAEDLWAFNSEEIARAVASSSLPVISAVGHQSDFTLCDMVADCSAGTPSMAAELAVPDSSQIEQKLESYLTIAYRKIQKIIDDKRLFLDERSNIIELFSPKNKLKNLSLTLDANEQRLGSGIKSKIRESELSLAELASKLAALSPLSVLARGYGFIQTDDQKTVCSVEDLSPSDEVNIVMSDGHARAIIKEIHKN